jgi:hypothetical protein
MHGGNLDDRSLVGSACDSVRQLSEFWVSTTKGSSCAPSSSHSTSPRRSLPVIHSSSILNNLFTRQSLLLSKHSIMKSLFIIGSALLGLSKLITNAAAVPVEHMEMAHVGTRDTIESRQSSSPCTHGPTSRQCWTSGFCEFYNALGGNQLILDSGLDRHVHFVAKHWSDSFLQSPH